MRIISDHYGIYSHFFFYLKCAELDNSLYSFVSNLKTYANSFENISIYCYHLNTNKILVRVIFIIQQQLTG